MKIIAACAVYIFLTSIAWAEANQLPNDPFLNNQWGLINTGQPISFDIDDIHSEKWVGIPGTDIGYDSHGISFDSQMKRNVVVAVLDTGLDIEHPDIKNNIFKNTVECDQNRIPVQPKEDKDQNGFKGDCMGWDFTAVDERLANRPYDEVGHGTHVAGIIAAERNNNIGIAGFSNKIKILPLKVLLPDVLEAKLANAPKPAEGSARKDMRIGARLARAIQYATTMNVDVINMSLGWPDRADTKELRQAVEGALAKNISIVVAAGNNDNGLQLFPCAYKNVICVGSIDNRGRASLFSNFGSHIDFMAPGDMILSLAPMTMDTSSFPVSGYAYISGTSQSAPFVSAQVAVLRGVYPGISNDEIHGRLWAAASRLSENDLKTSLSGLPKLSQAIKQKPVPLVRPVFKEMSRVLYSMSEKAITVNLPIKNYWADAKNVVLSLHLESDNFRLITPQTMALGALSTGDEKSIIIKAKILSVSSPSEFNFSVKVNFKDGSSETFRHSLVVSRTMEQDSAFRPIMIRDLHNHSAKDLATVYPQGQIYNSPEYYVSEMSAQEAVLKIFSLQGDFLKPKISLQVPFTDMILLITKVDLNYDGEADYLVVSRHNNDNKDRYIQYSFFKADGSPVIGASPHFRFDFQGEFSDFISDFLSLSRNFSELKFIKVKTEFGLFAVPIYFGKGLISAADFKHTQIEFAKNDPKSRLYYFLPTKDGSGQKLSIRTYTNNDFDKNIRLETKIKARENIQMLNILPQTETQKQSGYVQLLFSVGEDYLQKHFVLKIGENEVLSRSVSYREIHSTDEAFWGGTMGSSQSLAKIQGASYVSFLNTQAANLSFINLEDLQIQSFPIEYKNPYDHLVGLIKAYEFSDSHFGVYATQSLLLMQVNDRQGSRILTRPLLRSTFLPGQQFEETIHPITYHDRPALYVNAGLVSSRYIYLVSVDQGGLISNLEYNIDIPLECAALDPARTGEEGHYSYAIMCDESTGPVLKLLPLK